MKTVHIELTHQEVETVANILAQRPYIEVAPLIDKIMGQARAQLAAAAEARTADEEAARAIQAAQKAQTAAETGQAGLTD